MHFITSKQDVLHGKEGEPVSFIKQLSDLGKLMILLLILPKIYFLFRAYYKNSYMMQRNEAKIRKSFLDSRNYNDDISTRRSSKQTFKENANCTNYVSTSGIEKNKISTGLKNFLSDTNSNCHKHSGWNSYFVVLPCLDR